MKALSIQFNKLIMNKALKGKWTLENWGQTKYPPKFFLNVKDVMSN